MYDYAVSNDEVAFFRKFNKRANTRRGLCETCKQELNCKIPWNPMRAIMQCEKYEKAEDSAKQIQKEFAKVC